MSNGLFSQIILSIKNQDSEYLQTSNQRAILPPEAKLSEK